jgi:hypothetical protein
VNSTGIAWLMAAHNYEYCVSVVAFRTIFSMRWQQVKVVQKLQSEALYITGFRVSER